MAAKTGTGIYTAAINNAGKRYGVAVADALITPVTITVVQATLDELPKVTVPVLDTDLGSASLNGSLSGLAGGRALLALAGSNNYLSMVSGASYTLSTVPCTRDFAALRYGASWGPPDKVILQRDLAVSGAVTKNLDFAGADAVAMTGPYTLTVNGSPMFTTVNLRLRNGLTIDVGNNTSLATTIPYGALPANLLNNDEGYEIVAGATLSSEYTYFKTPGTRTYDFFSGATGGFPSGSVDVTGTTPKFSWTPYTGATAYQFTVYSAQSYWQCYVTPAWASTQKFNMPDLTSLTGWQTTWRPQGTSSMAQYTANQSISNLMNNRLAGKFIDGLHITTTASFTGAVP